jgi:hypothetical protein
MKIKTQNCLCYENFSASPPTLLPPTGSLSGSNGSGPCMHDKHVYPVLPAAPALLLRGALAISPHARSVQRGASEALQHGASQGLHDAACPNSRALRAR